MLSLELEDSLGIFRNFDLDKILKFLTALSFLICLTLSIIKAYQAEHISSVLLLVLSFYSAFINDRILVDTGEQK